MVAVATVPKVLAAVMGEVELLQSSSSDNEQQWRGHQIQGEKMETKACTQPGKKSAVVASQAVDFVAIPLLVFAAFTAGMCCGTHQAVHPTPVVRISLLPSCEFLLMPYPSGAKHICAEDRANDHSQTRSPILTACLPKTCRL